MTITVTMVMMFVQDIVNSTPPTGGMQTLLKARQLKWYKSCTVLTMSATSVPYATKSYSPSLSSQSIRRSTCVHFFIR